MMHCQEQQDINPIMIRLLPAGKETPCYKEVSDNPALLVDGCSPGYPGQWLIRMRGEAMVDAHIPDNALLLVVPCIKPQHNSIVLAVVKEEIMVRRYVKNSSGARLMPANLKYDPIPLCEGTDYSIRGKVIRVLIDIYP
jgi:repressor LexA